MMEMEFLRKLPTPQEIKEEFPLYREIEQIKAERDQILKNIFEGKDDRLLLLIGPCSADNEDAVQGPMSNSSQSSFPYKIFFKN